MTAIISAPGRKLLSPRELARPYCSAMVTSREVRVALRALMGRDSPDEFADAAGVDRSTVYRILGVDREKEYSPRIETVSALVESKGQTLAAFFAGVEGLRSPTDRPIVDQRSPVLDQGHSEKENPSLSLEALREAFVELCLHAAADERSQTTRGILKELAFSFARLAPRGQNAEAGGDTA